MILMGNGNSVATLGRIATEIKSRDLKQAEERLTLAQQQLEAAKQE